jgi:hypothetical protein
VKVASSKVAWVAAALAVVVAASPVQAQGDAVWYDGIGFAFVPELGRSVNIARVRATPADEFQDGEPAHVSFTLYGSRDAGARPPAIGGPFGSPREVRVYGVAALDALEGTRDQVAALRRLLDERPDLTDLTTVAGPLDTWLPEVPPVTEAARIVQARPQYIDTPEVSGIAYIASYAQDIVPPTSDDLLWLFQGISADGTRYVAITWGLDTDLLPDEVPESVFERIDRDWPRILGQATTAIEDGAPDAFTPGLDALEALVRSMVLPGGPSSAQPTSSPAA